MMQAIDIQAGNSPARFSNQRLLSRTSQIALCVALALIFALLLSGREIPAALDDDNYLTYASVSSEILDVKLQESSGFGLFFAEPLWLLLNSGLALFFDAEVVVRIIIFCSVLAASISVARLVNWSALQCIAFFLFPMVLVPHVTHLRQGVAIALFFAFLAFGPKRVVIGTALAAAIHSSFIPMFILIAVDRSAVFQRALNRLSPWATSAAWLGLVALTPLFLRDVLGWADDRRTGEYGYGIESSATGLGFLLWAAIAAILFLGRQRSASPNWRIAIAMVTLFLGWYFFLEIGSRVLTSALIFVWLAGSELKTAYRNAFLVIWFGAGAYVWMNQLNRSAFYGF